MEFSFRRFEAALVLLKIPVFCYGLFLYPNFIDTYSKKRKKEKKKKREKRRKKEKKKLRRGKLEKIGKNNYQ